MVAKLFNFPTNLSMSSQIYCAKDINFENYLNIFIQLDIRI